MCSFGSCQTRFEFLSQFRKVRNAFECFVTQVQTHLPKIKRVWPMKINVICTVYVEKFIYDTIFQHCYDYRWLGFNSRQALSPSYRISIELYIVRPLPNV